MIICSCHTATDLVELEMVDFNVIMGMDWLASSHAMVDCRTKVVRFQFSSEPVLERVTLSPLRVGLLPTLRRGSDL